MRKRRDPSFKIFNRSCRACRSQLRDGLVFLWRVAADADRTELGSQQFTSQRIASISPGAIPQDAADIIIHNGRLMMVKTTIFFTFLCILVWAAICSCTQAESNKAESARIRAKLAAIPLDQKVHFTNDEWKYILTSRQYYVLRKGGTELPFTNAYWRNHDKGTYVCAACGNPLFAWDTKYDSRTGWPSFWQPINKNAVSASHDSSFGMSRDEITCARCGSHLGHVFDDGPKPTGLRYCMNSAALKLVRASK